MSAAKAEHNPTNTASISVKFLALMFRSRHWVKRIIHEVSFLFVLSIIIVDNPLLSYHLNLSVGTQFDDARGRGSCRLVLTHTYDIVYSLLYLVTNLSK